MATGRDEGVSAYRWVVLGAFSSGGATALATIFVFGLLLPDISEELRLSPSQQGWLGASAVFGNLLLGIPLNEWLSRYRPRRVVALCFLGIGVFTLLQGWSPTLAVLIVGRLALGISMIATQAPRALLIQQWTPAGRLPFTQAVMFGATSVVWGLALFVTPPLLGVVGSWRNILYILGGLGILSTLLWIILGRERVTAEYSVSMESQLQSPLLNALKYKQIWFLGLAMFSGTVTITSFDVFWPTFAQKDLGVSLGIAGITVGIVLLVAGPAVILVNSVPDLARRQWWVLGAARDCLYRHQHGTVASRLDSGVVHGGGGARVGPLLLHCHHDHGVPTTRDQAARGGGRAGRGVDVRLDRRSHWAAAGGVCTGSHGRTALGAIHHGVRPVPGAGLGGRASVAFVPGSDPGQANMISDRPA